MGPFITESPWSRVSKRNGRSNICPSGTQPESTGVPVMAR